MHISSNDFMIICINFSTTKISDQKKSEGLLRHANRTAHLDGDLVGADCYLLDCGFMGRQRERQPMDGLYITSDRLRTQSHRIHILHVVLHCVPDLQDELSSR
jgi:hypothetical protein